ncbi:MAG: mechanosensitive ion channel family protein [Limnochordales bacterium]|nr:mechanosensitive ion channel family protein [Limnochordales bacterium]
MPEWLPNGLSQAFSLEGLLRGGRTLLVILVIVLLARIAVAIGNRIIDHVFLAVNGRTRFAQLDEKRARTVASLIKSLAFYTIYFIAGVMVLDQLGINTASLLAAAGVAGLAIGFGAQNLVKDVVSGFFILFEGQFQVGDYITTAGVSGIVEATGLRTTWIRAFDGALHIIPNGEMRQVTNHMGPAMRVMFQVAIPYEADVDRAIAALQEGFDALRESGELPDIVDGPTVLGVQELSERGVELLIWARAKTMTQWAMTRELRKRVKQILDAEGIPVAFPRRLLVVNQGALGVGPGTGYSSGPAAGSGPGSELAAAAEPAAAAQGRPGSGPASLLEAPPGALSATESAPEPEPGPGPDLAPEGQRGGGTARSAGPGTATGRGGGAGAARGSGPGADAGSGRGSGSGAGSGLGQAGRR